MLTKTYHFAILYVYYHLTGAYVELMGGDLTKGHIKRRSSVEGGI